MVEVAVIGAGFGGIAVAHRLAQDGIDDVVILERSDGVGGTWRANTYPGAACDVPSHLYSLSFAPNPGWTQAYASQPEILAYLEDCYDRFDVRRKVRTGVAVTGCEWIETEGCWRVRDRSGAHLDARVVVSAIGMFHTPSCPTIPGLATFEGATFHSAEWDHGHDLRGRRVAVVGTGASAIQIVPAIAGTAAHVDVYQRTAPWVLPRRNDPYSAEQRHRFATEPQTAVEHRQALHDLLESSTIFLTGDPGAEAIASIARQHLADQVDDPALRAALTPTHPFGCTRPLLSSDYYPALQREDVDLVTTAIERVTPTSIRTVDGREHPTDTIVLSTGFRAAAYLEGIDVLGRDGQRLHDVWAGRPRAYHGLAVPGFPNFFMVYGPNTNQGGNSIILILEAQAQFVAEALAAIREGGATSLEVRPEAMARYEAGLERDLAATVWTDGCRSYFHTPGGDVVTQLPRKSGWYRAATEAVDRSDIVLGGAPCPNS